MAFTKEQFVGQVHTHFRLEATSGESADLELIQAEDRGSTRRLEQFAILLRGPQDRVLPQRIYQLEHLALGRLELFLVPVGRDAQGVLYEAVFTRPRRITSDCENGFA